MAAAIYFHPEGYRTDGPKLMGRHAAGESFLRGYLQYSTTDRFWVQAQQREHANVFAQTARRFGRQEPVHLIDAGNLGTLAEPGCAYYPGPGLGLNAWQRAPFGHTRWSLCGITHTTSSAGAMDSIVDLLTAPVQPWDAVICTSPSVKQHVETTLTAQAEYLKDRLGITRLPVPQLPVIPLGVHTADFEFTTAQRRDARKAIGAGADALVVMFIGRLSFHAKAHPLAMYQALERVALQQPKKPVVLVECGWHANDHIRKAFDDAAQAACPSVRHLHLDGRDPAARTTAWASADVFCSLSDNIQETFGITPIEAMAAGLPVVVSDWDGYKDSVRDGIDGFRIPTVMPCEGLGGDLALRHALEVDTYDAYCGYTSSFVGVDVDAAAVAFSELARSPKLRKQMGQAGRERARSVYDWSKLIPQYEALWADLAARRKAAEATHKPLARPWPARMDPFYAFAHYPTHTLRPDTRLMLAAGATEIQASERVEQLRSLAMVDFVKTVLPQTDEIRQVLHQAANGPRNAQELVSTIERARQPHVLRALAWLTKLGVLKIAPV